MQRDIGPVLDRELPRLLDQEIALGRIGFQENLVGKIVELLVAIAGEIGFAAVGILGIVPAAHDVVQHVMGVERIGGPAQHEQRGLVAAGLQHLGKIQRLRLCQQVHLDVDTGEHADDRLADRSVIDVAIVGAVHCHFETVGVAGVRQELLGAVGIELRPGEVL